MRAGFGCCCILLLSLTGCQCFPVVTECYQDDIDVIADHECQLDWLYHPGLDLTRIGYPDWCRSKVGHWLCGDRCGCCRRPPDYDHYPIYVPDREPLAAGPVEDIPSVPPVSPQQRLDVDPAQVPINPEKVLDPLDPLPPKLPEPPLPMPPNGDASKLQNREETNNVPGQPRVIPDSKAIDPGVDPAPANRSRRVPAGGAAPGTLPPDPLPPQTLKERLFLPASHRSNGSSPIAAGVVRAIAVGETASEEADRGTTDAVAKEKAIDAVTGATRSSSVGRTSSEWKSSKPSESRQSTASDPGTSRTRVIHAPAGMPGSR